MAIESIFADAFFSHVLLADAELTGADALNGAYVWNWIAPQGSPTPRVLYNFMGGSDVNGHGAVRLFTRALYQVRTILHAPNGTATPAALQRFRRISSRVDDVLQGIRRESFTIEGETYNFNVWRQGESPPRIEAGAFPGDFYRVNAALYRVEIFR